MRVSIEMSLFLLEFCTLEKLASVSRDSEVR